MYHAVKLLKTLICFLGSVFIMVPFGFAQQTLLLTESFESAMIPPGTIPPDGWAIELISGASPGVYFVTSSTDPTIETAYDGTNFVQYNSYVIPIGSTRLMSTTALSTINKSNILVDFAWFEDPGYTTSADIVEVQWSTNGIDWNTAATFSRYNAVAAWKVKNVLLPIGAGNQDTLYIAFQFTTAYGNNCAIDMITVTAGPLSPPSFATIGNGTTEVGWPYYTLYQGSRTQMLYTAAQLTAAGASACNLTSIGFNVASNSAQLMTSFEIKLGLTNIPSLTGWVNSGMNTVYQENYVVPGTGWRDITLTNPFPWDGISNVIVEICFGDNGSWISNSPVMGTVSSGTTWHYHDDFYAGCSGTAAGTAQTVTPDIRFGIPPVTLAALMGYVKDVNTMAPVAGAIVQVGSARDTSRANGFFIIYNLTEGLITATTSAAGYVTGSEDINVVSGTATFIDIMMNPGPFVAGMVTDSLTGMPVMGASVTVGTGADAVTTLTVEGGTYQSPALSVTGAQPILIGKTGYIDFSGTVALVPNTVTVQDAALLPSAVQPGIFTAALNNPVTPTEVNLTWGVPQGMYQIIYDDGIQDDIAIWAEATNLNAMKFTPLAWPVKLVGGKVNLGVSADYPADALPLTPFMMLACKADGAGGLPGTLIDSVEVT
ncbi:MAG: hypothetical protein NTW16_11020, partial [Bacteroidetes bacterium]|nr:hypothetical protein [Bacteroidota bacterium]